MSSVLPIAWSFLLFYLGGLSHATYSPLFVALYSAATQEPLTLCAHVIVISVGFALLSSLEHPFLFLLFNLVITWILSILLLRTSRHLIVQWIGVGIASCLFHTLGMLRMGFYGTFRWCDLFHVFELTFKDMGYTVLVYYLPFLFYRFLRKMRNYVTPRKRYR